MSISTSNSIPEDFVPLLEAPAIGFLATIGPAGEPQTSPVWYDWNGESILIAVLEETQKRKNIFRDPRVAFSIVDPANAGRYIEVRGTVSYVLDRNDEYGDRLARKYLNLDHLPWTTPDVKRWILTIHPTRVITQR